MSPEPPGEPPSGGGDPSAGVPRPIDQVKSAPTITARTRSQTLFSQDNPVWRFVKRWGFALAIVLIVIWGHAVLLPFIFAALVAYILAPVVKWMTDRKDGTRRMPRAVAIILCYIAFIALMTGFMFLLVPRLSADMARIGKEAPGLYKTMNEEWTPDIARWLEDRFPSLAAPPPMADDAPALPAAPLPPGTAFTATQLPDGRLAIQIAPNGIDVRQLPDGTYRVQANENPPAPATLEDKLRSFVKRGMLALQSQVDDLVKLGQSLISGFIKGIVMFFFTLMLGAFILIDLEKVHGFMRMLFPANVRDDYDVIMEGIDRGLSGVIRGQLLICLVNGIFTYIGLLIFGVKYSLILAIVAGMMSLIPIFGSFLSSVPIVAVALVSGESGLDIFRGVAMTLWIIGIHFIEANLLNPKIIGSAAKIHPVFVVFSLFLGQSSYGLIGALLAVPILSAIQVVFMFLYRKTWQGRGTTGPVAAIPPPGPPPA
jgi:predicted PurR-regulated permease PerM